MSTGTTTAAISEEDRVLLAALAAGPGTDEVTARQLGISTRTLRRRLAGLMTRLGARSRFQAGVAAANAGLLDRTGQDTHIMPIHPGVEPCKPDPPTG